ncbi:integrase arm-type DNA-binding domain-containing protein [Achromobacter sp. NPDC058515]
MPLTDTAARQAKPTEKARKMTDGGGPYLLVNLQGKYWRWDCRRGTARR